MDTKRSIEAVLLNSEGEPEEEVGQAFLGVIGFARNEFGASDDQIRECFEHYLKQVPPVGKTRNDHDPHPLLD